MKIKRLGVLAIISIFVRSIAFYTIKLGIEEYTNGYFTKIGLGYAEFLDYCALKSSGINYCMAKNNDFPALILSLLSGACNWILKTNAYGEEAGDCYYRGKLFMFSIITIMEIFQGIIIYNYLCKSYFEILKFNNKIVGKSTYEDYAFYLLAFYWLNPVSIYSSISLSIVSTIEFTILLLMILLSLRSSSKRMVSALFGFLIYISPRKYISLFPVLVCSNFEQNEFDLNQKMEKYGIINQGKKDVFGIIHRIKCYYDDLKNSVVYMINIYNLKLLLNFTLSFLVTLIVLHTFSCFLLAKMDPFDYYLRFIYSHFSFTENRDLAPYLNFYWFTMTTIMERFKFYFQLILSSFLVLYSGNILIGFKDVIYKALISQFFLIHILGESPNLLNYIVVLMFISFDYFTLFEAKFEFLFSASFLIWFFTFSLSFLIRSTWITQNRLNSNMFYFITFSGNVAFILIIGEWNKNIFNCLVKERKFNSIISKECSKTNYKGKTE
ncbi:hypothetical protein FG379_000583 [Cryptosporidium bovis]|uniref:uncharacterized protein n=1 Tax=Cryptosporidium bovis TaxID=310047 RepID=UPI00351A8410|nr:hypothetical protein FG379_000583 [Cryptosporidium bovis]